MTAQTNPPQQVQVGQTVSQGLLVYKVQPTYPPLARQARAQGTVVLQAVIGKDGTIEELSVISGHPLLTQAAVDAVKQWRYKPYLLNGEPVLVQTTINVNFELNGPAPEVPPNEPAANSSSSESRNSNPPSTPQTGQGATERSVSRRSARRRGCERPEINLWARPAVFRGSPQGALRRHGRFVVGGRCGRIAAKYQSTALAGYGAGRRGDQHREAMAVSTGHEGRQAGSRDDQCSD